MSRCYPFPPPGYEKKPAQLPEILPSSKKEKHKHKDKEKKKKRKREEGSKDENAHKDKRSSKHHKANDVVGVVHSANGRVQHEADIGGRDDEAGNSALQSAQPVQTVQPDRGVRDPDRGVREPDRGVREPDRSRVQADRGTTRPDKGKVEADKSAYRGVFEAEKGRAGYGESSDHAEKERREAAERFEGPKSERFEGPRRESDRVLGLGHSQVDRTGSGRPPEKKPSPAAPKPNDRDRGKEVNGRVPSSSVLPKPLDTGQAPQRPRDQHRDAKSGDPKLKPATDVKLKSVADGKSTTSAAVPPRNSEVKPAAVAVVPPSNSKVVPPTLPSTVVPSVPDVKPVVPNDVTKVKAAEKETKEKRSRSSGPIELPPVGKIDDDDIEWLISSNKRKVDAGGDTTMTDVTTTTTKATMVWAEAVLLPEVGIYARPYVVPY